MRKSRLVALITDSLVQDIETASHFREQVLGVKVTALEHYRAINQLKVEVLRYLSSGSH